MTLRPIHRLSMRTPLSVAACGLFSAPAISAGLDLSVQIRLLPVAEYHRPYIAIWLERDDHSAAANLAIWYQQKRAGGPAPGPNPNAESGTKYLPDLRQWWRRSGRELSLPVDGLSGATRSAGEQQLVFSNGQAPLGALASGQYTLKIEAAREDGGRELIDIPFAWPAASPQTFKAQGQSELGAVTLTLKP